jgi:hypothetical protein
LTLTNQSHQTVYIVLHIVAKIMPIIGDNIIITVLSVSYHYFLERFFTIMGNTVIILLHRTMQSVAGGYAIGCTFVEG